MPDYKAELDRAMAANQALRRENVDLSQRVKLLQLRAENDALKRAQSTGLRFRVAPKGGLSVYGLQRLPVTLFKSQWLKLLDATEEIREFLVANDARLASKDSSPKVLSMDRRKADRR